jgi:nucleoside-diphosphate-sugar epimerase
VFNAGYENHTVMQIAELVRGNVGRDVEIVATPTDDNRSYHVSSEKMQRVLGFTPRHTIGDAVSSLSAAFAAGKVPNPMQDPVYYNVKLMQQIALH